MGVATVVEVCERLAALTPPSKRDVHQIVQINEKWGELRIDLTTCNTKMRRDLMSARRRSHPHLRDLWSSWQAHDGTWSLRNRGTDRVC